MPGLLKPGLLEPRLLVRRLSMSSRRWNDWAMENDWAMDWAHPKKLGVDRLQVAFSKLRWIGSQ